jgi:Mg/Co/Ni transporter MgtE
MREIMTGALLGVFCAMAMYGGFCLLQHIWPIDWGH